MAGNELQVQQVGWIAGHAEHLIGGAANRGNIGVDYLRRRFGITEQDRPRFWLDLDQRFQRWIIGLGGHRCLREANLQPWLGRITREPEFRGKVKKES